MVFHGYAPPAASRFSVRGTDNSTLISMIRAGRSQMRYDLKVECPGLDVWEFEAHFTLSI